MSNTKELEELLRDLTFIDENADLGQAIFDIRTRLEKYASATPQPLSPQGSGMKEGWDTALTLANNLCVQISDGYNNDDFTTEAEVANECAEKIRAFIGDYSPLDDIKVSPASQKEKPDKEPESQREGMSAEDVLDKHLQEIKTEYGISISLKEYERRMFLAAMREYAATTPTSAKTDKEIEELAEAGHINKLQYDFVFGFKSHQNWVNKAKDYFSVYRKWTGDCSEQIICLDVNGNALTLGEDFSIAESKNLFPVKCYRLIRTSEVNK